MAEPSGAPALYAALVSTRKDSGAERLTELIRHHRRCIFGKLSQFIQRRAIPRRIPCVKFGHHRVVCIQWHLVFHMIGKLEKSRFRVNSRDEMPRAFLSLAIRVLIISIFNTCP